MSYLPIALLVAGLILLTVLLLRAYAGLRRWAAVSKVVRSGIRQDLARLRARRAASRVAVAELKARWRRADGQEQDNRGRTPTAEYHGAHAETGGPSC